MPRAEIKQLADSTIKFLTQTFLTVGVWLQVSMVSD